MKVKLTNKVSGFFYNGTDYKPGDKFEVDSSLFRSDFMQDLTPLPPIKPVKTVKSTKKKTEPAVTLVEEVLPEPETATGVNEPEESEAEMQ